jgi:serine/threonine protein kinase
LITDVIDYGGWGIVYKAVHASLNLPVAIKMLKHSMAMDLDFSTKFRNEAEVVARLNHRHVVRVYDIEHLYRTIFIIMEYVHGLSLKEMIAETPRLRFQRVLNLLIQVLEGLKYAHEQGIVHQDIKPANIMVEAGDRAKILDFGLACSIGHEEDLDLVGTPHYMAPEQLLGDPVDERTDIYSLGITAFEMATGRKPFAHSNVAEVFRSLRDSPVPDPRSLNSDLPREFTDFIRRATEKRPDDRFPNTDQALANLRHMARRWNVSSQAESPETLQMMSLLVRYRDTDQVELTRLVEQFKKKISALGADPHVANYGVPQVSAYTDQRTRE